MKALSPTMEDYIRAIYLLEKTGGAPGVSQIAEKLGLSKSTVSERIKELTEAGYTATTPYAPITLTKKGKKFGNNLTYKHRLIEVFLYKTLNVPDHLVHAEAERLEHAFSDQTIKKLDEFLEFPTHDPHGSLIPR
jgi:DtxR family Mn-dependent transcriptional regulator